MLKVFFDCDPAVYMAAFASQTTTYSVIYEDLAGNLHEVRFPDGASKKKWLNEQTDIFVLDEQKLFTPEPEAHARQCARTLIRHALQDIERRFKQELDVEYYLSGTNNFRDRIATIAEYKGHRKDQEKPVHHGTVREYLIENYGAKIIDGIEADDEVSIRAWEFWRNSVEPYVVVTIDKDLDQIPGMHYDYKRKVFYDVDELDADLFFYAQTVSGDATDNIKGCYRLGATRAAKLVDVWFEERPDERSIPYGDYLWAKIIETYEENRKRYGPERTFPEKMRSVDAALENARLVRLQRERGELWTPASMSS